MLTSSEKGAEHGWRQRLWVVIFKADTPAGRAFDIVLIVAIVASVVTVMVESVAHIRAAHGPLLRGIEWGFTVLFTIEYLLRLSCVRKPLRYTTSFFGIIDLMAILPTYLSLFFPGAETLLVVRFLRVLRIFRVLKLTEYLRESRVLAGYTGDGLPANADVRVGKVTIEGDFAASNVVAGALAGAEPYFGNDEDTLIPDGNGIVSQIASVVIKGAVTGSAGPGDGFGVVAEELGKFKIGDTALDLSRGPRNDLTSILLGGTDDVRAREVGEDT